MSWLRDLFRRKPNGPAPEVKEAKQVQAQQFEEWGNVMREVKRVEKIASGEKRPAPPH